MSQCGIEGCQNNAGTHRVRGLGVVTYVEEGGRTGQVAEVEVAICDDHHRALVEPLHVSLG